MEKNTDEMYQIALEDAHPGRQSSIPIPGGGKKRPVSAIHDSLLGDREDFCPEGRRLFESPGKENIPCWYKDGIDPRRRCRQVPWETTIVDDSPIRQYRVGDRPHSSQGTREHAKVHDTPTPKPRGKLRAVHMSPGAEERLRKSSIGSGRSSSPPPAFPATSSPLGFPQLAVRQVPIPAPAPANSRLQLLRAAALANGGTPTSPRVISPPSVRLSHRREKVPGQTSWSPKKEKKQWKFKTMLEKQKAKSIVSDDDEGVFRMSL